MVNNAIYIRLCANSPLLLHDNLGWFNSQMKRLKQSTVKLAILRRRSTAVGSLAQVPLQH